MSSCVMGQMNSEGTSTSLEQSVSSAVSIGSFAFGGIVMVLIRMVCFIVAS